MWDLPQLAGELQDWYNRISQIWAKEHCQSVLTGNSALHMPQAPLTPAHFVSLQLAVVSKKSAMIDLKLRKPSPNWHPPTPGNPKERAEGRKPGCPIPSHLPKAAHGCPRPSLPLACARTHGVVVLGNDLRALKVAFTPVDFSTLVGEYARHRWATFAEGRGAG